MQTEDTALGVPDEDARVTCDVAIVGSGMGGGTFANSLRASGLRVLVIERGDHLPREDANWDPQAVFGVGRYRNAEAWIDGNTNKPFFPGVFYYVGGNTKVYGAMLPRFRESDFGPTRHREGVSKGWPIDYAALEPWYARAEQLYRVHGTAGADPTDPWRSSPFPYPALAHDPAIAPLANSLAASGLRPFVMPAGVDFGIGRPCILCSTCDGYPCKIDAKCDSEISALRPALTDANVSLLTRTKIDRLETDADGTRVVALLGKRDGRAVRIEAGRVVLAAGAVNTAALLLRSRTARHDRGLGNSSGQVGRNYMVHNSTFMLAVDPRRTNTVSFQKTLAFNDWYEAGADHAFPLGNVQMLGKIREQMVTPMRPWVPKILSRYITDHSVDLYLTSEDLASDANRIDLDPDSGAIRVFWTPNNLVAHRQLVRRSARALRKAGYPLILAERMGIATNSHQCGTAVMGNDARDSVVGTDCRMHDLDNVWIADSASFPSSAAVNPGLTIAANAMRVAAVFTKI